MKIPKKVKIGGLTYTVEITDNLFLGAANYCGEITYDTLMIRVKPQAKEKMEADFLHEVMHGIFNFLGLEQDERHIEEIAQALYALIVDNPEMFSEEGSNNEQTEESLS